jgi:AcrR family transcriptional regulator
MGTYSAVRDQNQEALRRTVIAAAEHLLTTHGAEAVTVRRVAQQLDCSTTVIYNLFGSKDGLANALYLQGCHLLHAALAAVSQHAEPARYLAALAWAYWDFAQQNPQHYAMMFSGALPDFKPDPASLDDFKMAINFVVAALERYRQEGLLAVDDPYLVAKMIWAAMHGVVHLFLAGNLDDPAVARALYERMIATVLGALGAALSEAR